MKKSLTSSKRRLDVVKNTKNKFVANTKNARGGTAYDFYFCNNGKYRIVKNMPLDFSTSKNIFVKTEKTAIDSFVEGAEFYLLIEEYRNKKTIHQIFCLSEFEIVTYDFCNKEERYIVK